MSAQAHLAGMFPPTERQEWKHDLAWHPVPVHTLPIKMDNLFGPWSHCDRFDYLMLQFTNTSTYKNSLIQYKSIIKDLEMYSGMKLESYKSTIK